MKRALMVLVVGVAGCGADAMPHGSDADTSDVAAREPLDLSAPPTGSGDLFDPDPPPDLASAPPADSAKGPMPDFATGVDPCKYATLGNGVYCGDNLSKMGDHNTLYNCQNMKTMTATPCANGCHLAPSGVPDYCEPPPTARVKGKGLWIWIFGQSAKSASDVAKECASWGVGFVLIKSGEDESTYTNNFSAANVAEFTSRGIEVYGWPYVRPGNIAAKADAIAQQAKVPGVSGIILDVETEFVGHGAEASALCDGIRARHPGGFLGYTTFGWVDYHLNFPYAEFDAHCGDAFLPQTYWDEWTTGPVGGLMKGREAYQAHGWKAPVWPAQDDYNGASVAGLNQFFDAAGPRASLWRYPDPGSAILNNLPPLHWHN